MKISCFVFLIALVFPCNLFAQKITTHTGTGIVGYSGDGGPATAAQLFRPGSVAVDAARNVYIADAGNYCIRRITPAGTVTTFAGNGTPGYSGDGGPATAARIGGNDTASAVVPMGLAIDSRGDVYISDGAHNVIRMVDTTGVIRTIAGTGVAGFSGDGGGAFVATLRNPQGMAFDNSGNLYFADCYNQRIRKISRFGYISTIAGDTLGIAGYSGDSGPATVARLQFPCDVAIDAIGNVFVADFENNRIRKIDTFGVIHTFAGTTAAGHTGDGAVATSAQLNHPVGVKFDGLGNLYVSDNYSSCVRRINATGIINGFAGNTIHGYSGDGGPATSAALYSPRGLAVDKDEFIFIADDSNARVRKVALITPITGTLTLCSGTTILLSNATVGGTWSSGNTGIATMGASSGIVYGIHPGSATITYATNAGSATIVVVVTGPTLSGLHTLPSLCNEDTVIYSPASTTSGAAFTWSRPYVAGIGSFGTSGSGSIMEILTNTSNIPIAVTYVYTITTTGCLNTENVVVNINPVPRLSSNPNPPAVCDTVVFNYGPTGYTWASTFAWSRVVTAGISNPAATGFGNPAEILADTTTHPVTVYYAYTLTANGCVNPVPDTVTVIVEPCRYLAVDDLQGNVHNVTLYPNPAYGQFNVGYSGVVNGQMIVSIFDITGRQLQIQMSEKSVACLSTGQYPRGLYICKITVNGLEYIRKLILN